MVNKGRGGEKKKKESILNSKAPQELICSQNATLAPLYIDTNLYVRLSTRNADA